MKLQYVSELIFITVLLGTCLGVAFVKRRKHPSRLSMNVIYVILSAFLPVGGSGIALLSSDKNLSSAGYAILFLGINILTFSMISFVMEYCELRYKNTTLQYVLLTMFAVNAASISINPLFHHVFDIVPHTFDDGSEYFSMIVHWGRYLSFSVVQVLFLIMVGTLIYKCTKISYAYHEKYVILIIGMIFCSVLETFFIFSGRTIDRSYVGYIICVLLIFFLTYIHKPLLIRRRLADAVVENHNDGIIFYDVEANALYANDRAYSILDIPSDTPDKCTDRLIDIMGGADVHVDFEISSKFILKDGSTRFITVNHRLMKDKRKLDVGSFFSVHDDTESVRLDERRRYLATHDDLTGLYNKSYFIEQVDSVRRSNPDIEYCMIVSDINDFKLVNDVFGKEEADNILISLGNSIKNYAHKGTIYCRWNGDVFAAFTRKSAVDSEELDKFVRNIYEHDATIRHQLVIHLGIYEMEAGEDIETTVMVDRALLAIGSIKNDYNNRLAVYDDKLRADRLWEQRITTELETAIKEGQLVPYIQPQYDSNGRLEGGEVLVRWIHPEEGFLAPYKFIPIFEKNGMIAKVDRYMWECACSILSRWKKEGNGREKLSLSINISPKDFYFLNIFEELTAIVEQYDVDPARLHLEITESAVMNNAAENIKLINELRNYGFMMEMDDFGSGYSSLNMLKDMPVDVLKIDMVFLGKTSNYSKAKTILNSIVDMANNLNMPQITEGVETKEQLEMLKSMGCKLFQGYYFSKPIPVEEFEKLPLEWTDETQVG